MKGRLAAWNGFSSGKGALQELTVDKNWTAERSIAQGVDSNGPSRGAVSATPEIFVTLEFQGIQL
ncbi:hypothetical protein [Paraburkholderia sp. 32]|uniref:hypothetical protein n=1 Tax=Paraburkholderia sp. 32 TaxID=2991057 RepID=UPI003D1F25F9